MKAGQFPKRFLSLRDKTGSHRRSKSSEPGHKNRPLPAEAFFALFKPDAAKQPKEEDDEKEKEAAKIEDVAQLLAESNITNITTEHIRDTLNTKFAAGDVHKAVEFIRLQQHSSSGQIFHYDPQVEMVGAENRGNVTCYLDALLFAMFARLDAYERMLKNEFTSEPSRRLVTLLRLWVNMLRSGKLIHTDMTQLIQDALADCGWKDARLLEQQDTSEAFAFITETLQLPLLQLQVDLFHQGENDKDDHKLVYERLLNLAVPPDPEGKGIKLEDCLEEYFNTQVDVLRDSYEEKKKFTDPPTPAPENTLRLVTQDDGLISEASDKLELSPLPMTPALERRWTAATGSNGDAGGDSPAGQVRPSPRHRSTSVIQRIVVGEDGRSKGPETSSILERAQKKSSTVVKAVTIPAWQFFRLIPWHVTGNQEPRNDVEVAMNFDQRPVVGICLKRYMMTTSGVPKRHNTFIDIPDSLRLPRFMVDEKQVEEDPNGFNTEYKLVLQSVVCHRGDSLQSGHYIAFARVAPKLLTDNRRHDLDPPPDYEEAQWVRFDDLHIENRVTYVDDIKESLKEEMPYLLFYQIVPMVEVASSEGTETEPPSYNASKVSINLSRTTSNLTDSNQGGATQPANGGYFDSADTVTPVKPPSIRFSTDLERPTRLSFSDDDPYANLNRDSRRGSMSITDSTLGTPAITPETMSPAVTPGEESTAQRLSRAAARFTSKTGSKSRPTSQAGEGRISLTMSRLGLTRVSKEPLRDSTSLVTSASPPVVPNTATVEEANEVVDEQPVQPSEAEGTSGHRHGHRRGKSKNRSVDKSKHKEHKEHKSGVPPERECNVM